MSGSRSHVGGVLLEFVCGQLHIHCVVTLTHLRGNAITPAGILLGHSMRHTSCWKATSKSISPAILSVGQTHARQLVEVSVSQRVQGNSVAHQGTRGSFAGWWKHCC